MTLGGLACSRWVNRVDSVVSLITGGTSGIGTANMWVWETNRQLTLF
jgi:hypothetical protein